MNPRPRVRIPGSLLLFGAFFLAAVVVVSLFRDFLRDSVLIPLLRASWVIGLVVKSIDQVCIWAAVVFVAALFSLGRLRRAPQERPSEYGSLPGAPERGRVRFWRNHLRLNAGESTLSRFLSAELRKLLLEVLAYREHLSPAEINRLVRLEQLEVPAEVRVVLEASEAPLETQTSPLSRLQAAMRYWLQRFKPASNRSTGRFESMAQYLEDTLEE